MGATGQVQRRSGNTSHQWLAHVEAQKKSGLNRTEYCKQYKISYHAMTYWTNKEHVSPGNKATLVPVQLGSVQLQQSFRLEVPALHIQLSKQISIAVGDNFSPNTLTRLLDTLEVR